MSRRKSRLFEAAGALFAASSGLDATMVSSSLAAREKLGSTGLGQGIAIPHGRIKGLKEARGAFLRLKQPVPFDAPDGRPVSQVFVLLVPEQATDLHLQLLSELAQMFSEKAFRERLAAATSADDLVHLFREWEARRRERRNPKGESKRESPPEADTHPLGSRGRYKEAEGERRSGHAPDQRAAAVRRQLRAAGTALERRPPGRQPRVDRRCRVEADRGPGRPHESHSSVPHPDPRARRKAPICAPCPKTSSIVSSTGSSRPS